MSSVSVLIGNGDGTFQPHVDYAPGTANFVSIAVGDFNEDGNLDIAAGQLVLLGNGDGTFKAPQQLLTASPSQIVIDVNDDGKLDIVEAIPSSGIVVYLGKGDGTFSSGGSYADHNSPIVVQAADVNADGKIDLVVLNSNPGSVSVLLGNGNGTFQNPSNVLSVSGVESGYSALALADFNGDGRTDFSVMTLSNQFNYNLITYLQGTWPVLQPFPSAVTFSQQAIGTSTAPQAVVLTNTGNTNLAISNIGITGANPGDFIQRSTCGPNLPVNATCEVTLTFVPTALGNRIALLSITDNAPGSPQGISLAGSTPPTPAISISPLSITFPSQYLTTIGAPQNVTVTNTGTAALNITGVASSSAEFEVLSGCGGNLAAGASCQMGVLFDPAASGNRSGTLTITDNLPGSPQTVSLSGMGEDFSLTAIQGSQTISPGQTGSYAISIAPAGGFNGTVALSCSGGPPQSTCAVSPASVALNGSSSATVTLLVSTSSSSVFPIGPDGGPFVSSRDWLPVAPLAWCALALLTILALTRRPRTPLGLISLVSVLLVLGLVMGIVACGSAGGGASGNSNRQPTTYPLTVVATFSTGPTTLTHSTSLSLILN